MLLAPAAILLLLVCGTVLTVRLRPFRAGKPIDLSHVFRENRGCNHVAFYRFVRTTGGSKATYWLEQTLLRRKPKRRDSVMTRQGAKIM